MPTSGFVLHWSSMREREREREREIKTNRTNGVEVLGRRGRKIKSIKSGELAYVCGGEKKRLKKRKKEKKRRNLMDEKKKRVKRKNKIRNKKLKLRNVIIIFSQYFHNKS